MLINCISSEQHINTFHVQCCYRFRLDLKDNLSHSYKYGTHDTAYIAHMRTRECSVYYNQIQITVRLDIC